MTVNSTRHKTDTMVFTGHESESFETVQVDFTELKKKKSEGVRKTQSFSVCIDECSRIVAVKPGRENAKTVIALLNRDMFKGVKCVVSDKGLAFRSQELAK